jgi:hypothetical protein
MDESITPAHVLYRFYSATGVLLYVGITVNPPLRFADHRAREWWNQVDTIKLETYRSRAELFDAERRAITTEHPVHNKVHRVRGPLPTIASVDPAAASERLMLSFRAAIEEFLDDVWPVLRLEAEHFDSSELRDALAEAHIEIARGLCGLIETAIGKPICVSHGLSPDPWINHWQSGFGWDVVDGEPG